MNNKKSSVEDRLSNLLEQTDLAAEAKIEQKRREDLKGEKKGPRILTIDTTDYSKVRIEVAFADSSEKALNIRCSKHGEWSSENFHVCPECLREKAPEKLIECPGCK